MVVRNGGYFMLGDKLCNCQPQRDIERYRKGILDDQYVESEFLIEGFNLILESFLDILDTPAYQACTIFGMKYLGMKI